LTVNAAAKPKMLRNDTLRTSIAYFEAGIEILVKNCPTKHFSEEELRQEELRQTNKTFHG
jgi:hypothetical protein